MQPLLDAVVRYLPSPLESDVKAMAHNDPSREIPLVADPAKTTVAMAFKIVEDPYGALTFMRLYQGRFVKGGTYYNQRNGRKERFSRIVRMHADQREDIDVAEAGEIVAVLGVDCASGDTYASEYPYCTLQKMFVPDPVIKMAISPLDRDGADRLSKALQRFRREDPTLHVTTDEETGETLISGMGELHLEIYVERIRREFKVQVEVGAAEGQLPREPHADRRVRRAAQEADRRLGPVRPHRRPHGGPARRRRGHLRLRGGGDRRPGAQAVHSGRREGLPQEPGQGPAGRLSGGQSESGPHRRLLPRGRQLRPGLPDLRPDDDAGELLPHPARAPGAGDADRDRVSQPVPGLRGGRPDQPRAA